MRNIAFSLMACMLKNQPDAIKIQAKSTSHTQESASTIDDLTYNGIGQTRVMKAENSNWNQPVPDDTATRWHYESDEYTALETT